MKAPEEIKKGLECHINGECNQSCPYFGIKFGCGPHMVPDALDLILQFEAQNTENAERIKQLEAERDQAVADLTKIVHECGEPCCEYCEWNGRSYCAGRCWMHNEGFKWRGVRKEDDHEQ